MGSIFDSIVASDKTNPTAIDAAIALSCSADLLLKPCPKFPKILDTGFRHIVRPVKKTRTVNAVPTLIKVRVSADCTT